MIHEATRIGNVRAIWCGFVDRSHLIRRNKRSETQTLPKHAKLGSDAGFVLKEPSKPDSVLWRKTHVHAPAFGGASPLHSTLLHCSLRRQLRIRSSIRRHATAAHADGERHTNRICLRAKYLGGAARGRRGAPRHEFPGPDDKSALLSGRKMDRL